MQDDIDSWANEGGSIEIDKTYLEEEKDELYRDFCEWSVHFIHENMDDKLLERMKQETDIDKFLVVGKCKLLRGIAPAYKVLQYSKLDPIHGYIMEVEIIDTGQLIELPYRQVILDPII